MRISAPHRISTIALVLASLHLVPHESWSAGLDPNAVVGLRVRTDDSSGHGTGFFTSSDGSIITCYHVIEGAKSITVLRGGRVPHRDVVVEAVWPERDLARLRVGELDEPTPFLPLDTEFRPDGFGIEVESLGFFFELGDAYTRGTLTHADWLQADRVRDKDGFAIFDQQADLIGLDILTYTGRSGSPILHERQVVGVLCGSLEEGREFTWAIPTKYLSDLRTVNRPPNQITDWAPVRLMERRYQRSLRSTFRLAADLDTQLDAYYDAVDALVRSDAKAESHLAAIREILPVVLSSLSQARNRLAMGGSFEDAIAGPVALLEQQLIFFESQEDAFELQMAARTQLGSATTRLGTGLDRLFNGSLPITARNLQVRDDLYSILDEANSRFGEILTDDSAERFAAFTNAFAAGAKRLGNAQDAQSRGAQIEEIDGSIGGLQVSLDELSEVIDNDYLHELNARRHEIIVDITQKFARLFYLNYDTAGPLHHQSDLGYDISLPSGWTIVSPQLLERLGLKDRIGILRANDEAFFRTGFFDAPGGNDSIDNIFVIVSTRQFQQQDVENSEPQLRRHWMSGLAMQQPRDYQSEWKNIGGKSALVLEVTGGDPDDPDRVQQVYVSGPSGRLVTMTCRSWEGRPMDFCDAALGAMQFYGRN